MTNQDRITHFKNEIKHYQSKLGMSGPCCSSCLERFQPSPENEGYSPCCNKSAVYDKDDIEEIIDRWVYRYESAIRQLEETQQQPQLLTAIDNSTGTQYQAADARKLRALLRRNGLSIKDFTQQNDWTWTK